MYDDIFKKNNKTIFFQNTLKVEIYTIGYSNQGESIVVLIKVDGKVKFSGVIDCYEYTLKNVKHNMTKRVLDDNKVKYLDFICWTHPDRDHSIGLDKIMNEYTNDKTRYWLPDGMYSNERNKSCFNNIFNEIDKKAIIGNIESIQRNNDLFSGRDIIFRNDYNSYRLYAKALTPIPAMIYMKKKNATYHPNDYSVSFYMGIACDEKMSNCRFLFTGDVEDDAIEMGIQNTIKKGSEFNYLKIPHHGSLSSEMLSDYIGKCDNACSTVFRLGRAKDPHKSIVDKYKKKTKKLFITNRKNMKKGMFYGMVKVEFDVINQKCIAEHYKDAYEYDCKKGIE